jgi:hypothetical protein
MDELRKFFGKPKSYVIGGEDWELMPLRGKDMGLLAGMKAGSEVEGMIALVTHYVKMRYPEATTDDINNFSATVINDFVKAIFDINGLQNDK